MHNLPWGLYMTVVGMGTVFVLLIVLMLLLMAIGRLDRPQNARTSVPATEPAPPTAAAPAVAIDRNGLTADELAAIAIAVITHAQVRRQQAAPVMRTHQPGSLLHASRWVAIGRGNQTQPWRRS